MERTDSLEKIARLAVRFRMLSAEQLQLVLADHSDPDTKGQQLVDSGLLNAAQLTFLVNTRDMKLMRNRDIKFGGIAVDMGFVTKQQVEAVLQKQKHFFVKEKKKRLIGDIMVEEQTITEEQKQSVIGAQKELMKEQRMMQAEQMGETLLTSGDGLEWLIDKKGRKATLRVPLEQPREDLLEHIHKGLEEHGITFGIVSDETITAWLDEEGRAESYVIAKGKEAVPGHGGEIVYHFDTDPLKAGKAKEGGVIDFKDRGEIPQVEEGTLLAELSEPDSGVEGTDVFGKAIPPKIKKSKKLVVGKGAVLGEGGRTIVADVTGRPSLVMNRRVCVYPQYKVDGNVGYETGHVDFEGEIIVSGTVERDFMVSGGSLNAHVVEAAEINIKGDVVISGGIIGAHIKAGGNVLASYIQDSTVEAGGNVLVKKEITGSDIKCSGGVYSASCVVLGSTISAAQGIVAKNIGSEVSASSSLSIGSDALLELQIEQIHKEIAQFENRQMDLNTLIERNKQEHQDIDMKIAETAQIQDRSQIELREMNEKIASLKEQGDQKQVNELETELPEIESRAKKAEQDLNDMFSRQDAIHTENTEAQQEIEELSEKLFYRKEDLEVLEEQHEDEQAEVSVKVKGTIYPLTTIATVHGMVKTKQEMKSIEVRERPNKTEAGDVVWKIVTEAYKG